MPFYPQSIDCKNIRVSFYFEQKHNGKNEHTLADRLRDHFCSIPHTAHNRHPIGINLKSWKSKNAHNTDHRPIDSPSRVQKQGRGRLGTIGSFRTAPAKAAGHEYLKMHSMTRVSIHK